MFEARLVQGALLKKVRAAGRAAGGGRRLPAAAGASCTDRCMVDPLLMNLRVVCAALIATRLLRQPAAAAAAPHHTLSLVARRAAAGGHSGADHGGQLRGQQCGPQPAGHGQQPCVAGGAAAALRRL